MHANRINPAIRAMLFDLDGTLLHSAPDLVEALNRVRDDEQLPPLSVEAMASYVSQGAIGLLRAGMPAADAATFEGWRQRFLEYYGANTYRYSTLYDGIPQVLAELHRRGMPWGIVTNKTESLTRPIVAAAGLDGTIACVVCGDTLTESKPDPAPVRLACRLLDVAPAEVLMVGDDERDIEAGRAAGTQTAAVYYGYGSHELNEECVRDSYRVHHPADLLGLLND